MTENLQRYRYPGNTFTTYEIPAFLLNEGPEVYMKKDSINIISPQDIIEDDLRFTLERNPLQHARLIVDLEHYGPTVKGNNLFFRIGKEAGVKQFVCDVNDASVQNKHFSQFNLLEAKTEQSFIQGIFFVDEDRQLPTAEYFKKSLLQTPESKYYNQLQINVFPRVEAVEYVLPTFAIKPEAVYDFARQLQELVKDYGAIRSFNGLKTNL